MVYSRIWYLEGSDILHECLGRWWYVGNSWCARFMSGWIMMVIF